MAPSYLGSGPDTSFTERTGDIGYNLARLRFGYRIERRFLHAESISASVVRGFRRGDQSTSHNPSSSGHSASTQVASCRNPAAFIESPISSQSNL